MKPATAQAPAQPINRQALLTQIRQTELFDLAAIGGGATGLGLALDAALRGLKVVLFEAHDFAKGTSSRATKLVHGGVRYLVQGHISLVKEALRERVNLLNNAPHLAQRLPFVVPGYHWLDTPFYGLGLKLYDALAGSAGLGATEFLSKGVALGIAPNLQSVGLKGAVRYWDGQFDDARLALALARTAVQQGALVANYCPVTRLNHHQGRICGLQAMDSETQEQFTINARCVVNATGVWVDEVRRKDRIAELDETAAPTVKPSQGVHIVVDAAFWPTQQALMIPKTHDGRVLFVVPWLGATLLGTTDTPRTDAPLEPLALAGEIDFILDHARHYLTKAPTRADIRSVWVGLRPLAATHGHSADETKSVSREHSVSHSASGLVTVTGGKWTTYRAMAEDVLAHCMRHRLLPNKPAGLTTQFPLLGAQGTQTPPVSTTQAQGLHIYGNEAHLVQSLLGSQNHLDGPLTEAMVRYAARYEMARTVEDMLARRWRVLFLNARYAASLAPQVAAILNSETGVDPQLTAFLALCEQYQHAP